MDTRVRTIELSMGQVENVEKETDKLIDDKSIIKAQLAKMETLVQNFITMHSECSKNVREELKLLSTAVNQLAVIKAREIATMEIKLQELEKRVMRLEK